MLIVAGTRLSVDAQSLSVTFENVSDGRITNFNSFTIDLFEASGFSTYLCATFSRCAFSIVVITKTGHIMTENYIFLESLNNRDLITCRCFIVNLTYKHYFFPRSRTDFESVIP